MGGAKARAASQLPFVQIRRPLWATWPRHRLGGLVSPALLGLSLSPALGGQTSDRGGKGGSQDPREGGTVSPRTQGPGLGWSALSCSVVLLASPPPAHGRSGGSGKGEIRRAWGAAGAANGTLQPPASSPSHAEMSHAEKAKLTLWPRNGLALGPPRGHSFHRAGHDTAFTLSEASWGPGDGFGVRSRLKSRCHPLSSLVFLVELSTLSLSFLVCKMET